MWWMPRLTEARSSGRFHALHLLGNWLRSPSQRSGYFAGCFAITNPAILL